MTLFFTLTSTKNMLKSNALQICTYIISVSWGSNIICSLLNTVLTIITKIKDYRKSRLVHPEPINVKTEDILMPENNYTLKSVSIHKSESLRISSSQKKSNDPLAYLKNDNLDIIDMEKISAK